VRRQIRDLFLPGVGTKPDWAAWTATETLFGGRFPVTLDLILNPRQ
jgi:hypothetical protein